MKKHFTDLFKYNHWANERMLITLQENTAPDEYLVALYSHLISAQIIWLNRIKDLPTAPFPVWKSYNMEELEGMTEESTSHWIDYLHQHKFQTFEEIIFYQNSQGKKFERTIREIITHVINHSTYHRGQMVSRMKEIGITPPPTDYILYCRIR